MHTLIINFYIFRGICKRKLKNNICLKTSLCNYILKWLAMSHIAFALDGNSGYPRNFRKILTGFVCNINVNKFNFPLCGIPNIICSISAKKKWIINITKFSYRLYSPFVVEIKSWRKNANILSAPSQPYLLTVGNFVAKKLSHACDFISNSAISFFDWTSNFSCMAFSKFSDNHSRSCSDLNKFKWKTLCQLGLMLVRNYLLYFNARKFSRC